MIWPFSTVAATVVVASVGTTLFATSDSASPSGSTSLETGFTLSRRSGRMDTSSGIANGVWLVAFRVATPTRMDAVEVAPNRSATA